jgi:uncharacterized protein involved in exopolysaccharide biosynthesis
MSARDNPDLDETLSFVELVRVVWARKFLVAALGFGGAVVGAGWSYLITPVYQAQVIMSPVSGESGGGGMLGEIAGQLGGLGSLVGPGLFNAQEREESVQFLRSRYIVERFVNENNLMPVLFAKRWDATAKKWKGDGKPPPTMGQAYQLFNQRIRLVADDRRSGLVSLTIRWHDRVQCARWANALTALANSELRARAIDESDRNIAYLNEELERTQQVERQQTILRIVESQIRTTMLAKGRVDYAFKVIDPAVVPDARERIRPKRAAMAAMGLVLGTVVGILWLLLGLMRKPPARPRTTPGSEPVV